MFDVADTQLKCCPWCGKQVEIYEFKNLFTVEPKIRSGGFYTTCCFGYFGYDGNCSEYGDMFSNYKNKDELIKAWNTRLI